MKKDLDELERKVAALIACVHALRETNGRLAAELDAARDRERAVTERMETARGRLDALIGRLPH